MSRLLTAPGKERTLGGLSGDGNLGFYSIRGRGLIAPLDRAKIDEGVFLFSLVREAGRAALLSAQTHFDVVVGTVWDLRNDAVTSQDHVEDALHFQLPPGRSIPRRGTDERIHAIAVLVGVGGFPTALHP